MWHRTITPEQRFFVEPIGTPSWVLSAGSGKASNFAHGCQGLESAFFGRGDEQTLQSWTDGRVAAGYPLTAPAVIEPEIC